MDAPEVFVKAGTAFLPGSSLAGNGLLVSDGEVWRRQRQLAAPAFRRAAVDSYAAAMASCTQAALADGRRWRGGVVRDVYPAFNDLTLGITMQALFGARLHAADANGITGLDLFRCSAAPLAPLARPPGRSIERARAHRRRSRPPRRPSTHAPRRRRCRLHPRRV